MSLSLSQRLRDWHARLTAPETDWIQVEVSSYCNAACVYCPRTVYRDVWINRHLSLATFKKLLPAIANTELVHLQGWGEPFLNPDFFTMVTLAKKAGARVGTTTNGMLVDSKLTERILASDLDFISFSLAGLGESNDRLRVGTEFCTVLDAIRELNRRKHEQGRSKPAIHVSYLLLGSKVNELMGLPDALQSLGISHVVISSLDFVPVGRFESETLSLDDESEYEDIERVLQLVEAAARSRGFAVHNNLGHLDSSRRECSENPQCAFFVSSDGTVSPCVFSNLPATRASHRVNGKTRQHNRLVFGNVNRDSLATIWGERSYTRFRQSFETGRLHPNCRDCYKLHVDQNGGIG